MPMLWSSPYTGESRAIDGSFTAHIERMLKEHDDDWY
jgi:hypothetical protein